MIYPPCPIPPVVPVKAHGARAWHRTWHHTGRLHHKLAAAGGITSFLCTVGVAARFVICPLAHFIGNPAVQPVVAVPEPASIAVFGVMVAVFAAIWSNRRARS